MRKIAAVAAVIVRSAVTWLTLAAAAVPLIAAEVAKALPESAERITAVGAVIVVWLGVAAAIIRIVTQVSRQLRGITPKPLTDAQLTVLLDARRYLARTGTTPTDLEAVVLRLRNDEAARRE